VNGYDILNEATRCFSLYYHQSFLEAVVIYMGTCRILDKKMAYEEIVQERFDNNPKELVLIRTFLNVSEEFLCEQFKSSMTDFFRNHPIVNKVDVKGEFECVVSYLLAFLEEKTKRSDIF
jgi:hypothetical protein